ncbi:hypothetical protein C8Q78DRAFT_1082618 [Trametes maxima]|nr:hypothetical protein C8Q78DRAFT_1082618 [Trametes maxima]
MDAQRFNLEVKRPIPLRIAVPQLQDLQQGDYVEYETDYPCPPPSTPYVQRRHTPFDTQRFDPSKSTLSVVSPPVAASSNHDGSRSYPHLADSVAFQFPVRDAYDDLLTYHLGEKVSGNDDPEDGIESGTATPLDDSETLGPSTTYRLTGASEDGDYTIERAILRPVPRHFDLSQSLATLAAKSTATLHRMRSFSGRSGGITPSSDTEDDDDSDNVIVAPPTSVATSRRPSTIAVPVTPLPMGEVTESLKRFAARLVPGHPSDGLFEEAVEHYENVWAQEERGEPLVEVFFTRKQETFVDRGDAFGLGHVRTRRSSGIGLYASSSSASSAVRG